MVCSARFVSALFLAINICATISLACREPPAYRRQSHRLPVNVHESFLSLPILRTLDLRPQLNITKGRQATIHLLGEKTCPSENGTLVHTGNYIPEVVSSKINGGTACPWHHVLNINKRRIPQVLVEAKCNCNHCIQGSKNTWCVGINKVLFRARCNSGEYSYTETLEEVNVGCTCVTDG